MRYIHVYFVGAGLYLVSVGLHSVCALRAGYLTMRVVFSWFRHFLV